LRFGGLQKFGGDFGGCRGCDGSRLLGGGSFGGSFRKLNAPKIGSGFGEFEFDVKARGRIGALARDLRDDFAARLLIGEEDQLAGSDGNGEANDAAVGEDQRGGGVFFEEFAFAGVFVGAGGHDFGFVRHGVCRRR
jgi:hypothetical protein